MNSNQHDLNLNADGTFNPATRMQRVSQRPGFIPLKTGDPIPDELRAQLNVAAFVRGLCESISDQTISTEGASPCISISK